MFHIKNNIATGLALVVLLTTTVAFARNENTNPLTGQIGVDAGDDSAESIKLRSGPGDPVAGKEKSQLCQGCHGEEGISIEGLIPKLAGQYGKYISKELRNYQAGTRSHQIMNAMAATISDDDLADIAAYFSSRAKMKGVGSNNELGKKLFLLGDISRTMVACIDCHGVNGKGLTPNTSMFPVIGGQQKDYIRRQLVNFRKGDRTNSPNGIMNRITQKLTDDELEAVEQLSRPVRGMACFTLKATLPLVLH
jgi:cytochrome c553